MSSASSPVHQPVLPEDDAELRQLIDEGLDDLDAGRWVDGETAMKELRQGIEARIAAARR